MQYRFGEGTKGQAESGGNVVPGVYEMRVESVEFLDRPGKDPQWEVKMAVERPLTDDGSPSGGCRDWITWNEKAEVRGFLFLRACGIDPETLGDFDLEQTGTRCVGKILRVTVEPHSYQNEKGESIATSRVGFRGYEAVTERAIAQTAAGDPPAKPTADAPAERPNYDDVPF